MQGFSVRVAMVLVSIPPWDIAEVQRLAWECRLLFVGGLRLLRLVTDVADAFLLMRQ